MKKTQVNSLKSEKQKWRKEIEQNKKKQLQEAIQKKKQILQHEAALKKTKQLQQVHRLNFFFLLMQSTWVWNKWGDAHGVMMNDALSGIILFRADQLIVTQRLRKVWWFV